MSSNHFSIPEFTVYPLSQEAIKLLGVLQARKSLEMSFDEYQKSKKDIIQLIMAQKVMREISENGVKISVLE